MLGLAPKNIVVESLGVEKLTCPVMLQGNLERISHVRHRFLAHLE
jgi:hypothetical protein